MATQGIVSVTQNGRTAIKVIAGCNGNRAKALASHIREWHQSGEQLTAELIERCALTLGFGCSDCRVVLSEEEALGAVDEMSSLYRQSFDDPRFNPRWQWGTADFVEVIEFDDV